ncbi:hypothetical protein QHI69_37995, partial (plasmid) [Burkholderia gladioli pv. gladioli]
EQERAARLRLLATSQKYGYRLLQCLDEHDDAYQNGSKSLEDIGSWNEARSALARLAQTLLSKASQGALRDACLTNLRLMRAARRGKPLNIVQAAKFKRRRIRTVRAWTEHKLRRSQVHDVVDPILESAELSEQAFAYIEEVIQATYQSLLDEVAWQHDETTDSGPSREAKTDAE